ncbi:hypothetical protein ACSBQT_11035 [Brevibacterium sp. H602]|uniref:hypothetical protein n=1 Tax=Brevibacterium sp. H602 TaxID=3444316 RepID=UPI003EBC13D7
MNEYVDYRGTWREWQKILNDQGARRGAEDRDPMAVRARVEWERDGPEWMDGEAVRIDRRDGAIFVRLHDGRCSTLGAWLTPDDLWWEGKSGIACQKSVKKDATPKL